MSAVVHGPSKARSDDPVAVMTGVLRSWHRPCEQAMTYEWLPSLHVSEPVLGAVDAAVKFTCRHLGLDVPLTLFYRASTKTAETSPFSFDAAERNGHADPETYTIGVRVEGDTSPELAAEVAAHEVRHLAQSGDPLSAQNEADALAYGKWASELLVRKGDRYAEAYVGGHRISDTFTASLPWEPDLRAKHGDVLLVGDERRVFVNMGSKASPRWTEHHRRWEGR